ncbi:MAG: fatty acid desaturase [Thiobacillus sp.]|jgi:alkane 1-monooxygenase|nr:fatty acid desaturase [Thiobacillus sp.]
MRSLIFGHLVYLYTPIGILATIAGILMGGPWVWIGIGIFGFNILMDTLTKGIHTRGAAVNKQGQPVGSAGILNLMMYFQLVSFVALQIAVVWRIYQYVAGVPIEMMSWNGYAYQNGITGLELVAVVVGAGMHQGLGIMFGHELSHTKGIGFLISRMMMSLSGCAAFCYAHVYNHHLELGRAWLGPEGNKMMDDTDPATAPRGRSLYAHWIISTIGQSYFGYRTEQRRLKRMGKSFFSLSNRWIRGYLMSLPTVALFGGIGYLAGGVDGALLSLGCMLLIWAISTFELEALNYMEHYGLIRVKGQPIEYRHSWDNDNAFTSWAFIEIGRQADHHDRGETHFWELSSVGQPSSPAGSPNAMMGYYTEFVLALIPPMWHAVYKKKLAIWDRDFASPEEQKIAREINRKVGYTVDPETVRGRKLEVNYAF